MDSQTLAIILITFVVLAIVYLILSGKKVGIPVPGPAASTLIDIHRLGISKMASLVKRFGPMFRIRLLPVNIIFLCDAESIREALVGMSDVFSGRITVPIINLISKNAGIAFVEGEKAQEQRRFLQGVLRRFGFGRRITENSIQDELQNVRDHFTSLRGAPTFPLRTLLQSAANVVSTTLVGERIAEVSDFEYLVRIASDITAPLLNSFSMGSFYKLIKLLPGDFTGLKRFLANNAGLESYLRRKIKEHRETFDYNNNSQRDLLDAYLTEMIQQEKQNPGQTAYTDFQLIRVLVEMLVAGMETTSTTLTWAILLMAKHPEIQERVQKELDAVIGDKMPEISDRSKLTYTTAVMHEVQRFVTVAAFGVFRRSVCDSEFKGYNVPANSIIVPYILGAHRDERIWKHPYEFDPTHFYDEATGSLINTNYLIPYGVGRRSCVGESLANQEFFVMFTGLMQRFRFQPHAEHPLPEVSYEYVAVPFRAAPEYKVQILERTDDECTIESFEHSIATQRDSLVRSI